MRVEVEVGGRQREVSLEWRGGAMVARLDGSEVAIDVAALGGGRWSLRFPDTGRQWDVVVASPGGPGVREVLVGGIPVPVNVRNGARRRSRAAEVDGPSRIAAPMPGKVVKLLVEVGQSVEVRQGLVVVEAMKMENELRASRAGVIRDILVAEGTSVEAGTLLVVIE
jgi:biotin carboxyl carrier protein